MANVQRTAFVVISAFQHSSHPGAEGRQIYTGPLGRSFQAPRRTRQFRPAVSRQLQAHRPQPSPLNNLPNNLVPPTPFCVSNSLLSNRHHGLECPRN